MHVSIGSPETGVMDVCETSCGCLVTDPKSSARAVSMLPHYAISLAPL